MTNCRTQLEAPPAGRRGFTVLELLVAISVIGLLVALLLPALMSAREAGRRITCASHLRQVGLAILQFHDRADQLPRAWRRADADNQFAYGWATQLLPELEQTSLSRELRVQNRPAQRDNVITSLPVFVCPSDITEPIFELSNADDNEAETASSHHDDPDTAPPLPMTLLPTANYQGVFGTVEADEADETPVTPGDTFGDGSLIHDRKVRLADLQRGASNTLLVGERTMAMIPSTWLGVDFRGEDAACRLVGSAMTRPNCAECDECEFSSRHPGGAAFVWADGRVTLLEDDIDSLVYRQLAQRAAE